MTAPGHCLSTHQDDALVLRQRNDPIETRSEQPCLHVIGIATEARVAPAGVVGLSPGSPQSAKSRDVAVVNSSPVQRRRKFGPVELRIVARPGVSSDVDDALDSVSPEQADELVDRSGRVANREDGRRCRVSRGSAGASARCRWAHLRSSRASGERSPVARA